MHQSKFYGISMVHSGTMVPFYTRLWKYFHRNSEKKPSALKDSCVDTVATSICEMPTVIKVTEDKGKQT